MATPIINRAHALYCNGELIGIITNPDPYTGGITDIVQNLADGSHRGSARIDAVTIPDHCYDAIKIGLNHADIYDDIAVEPY